MAFTHLHTHTEYSLLDGASRIKELCKRAKELKMDSLAITDHGVMYGVIEFYKECKKVGIKPIIGCEIYVTNESVEIKDKSNPYSHLVLLAENNDGYQNLIKIVSLGFTKGYYRKPRVDKKILKQYSKGIIALSACLAGEVQKTILNFGYDAAKDVVKEYIEIFGKNNFFLEIQNHGIKEQLQVIESNARLAKEFGIGLVCTNDSHYIYRDDEQPHDILLCIQTGKRLNDTDRMRYLGGQYYLKSPEEMKEIFKDYPEALNNTQIIAKRCNVEIEFGKLKLPKFNIETNETPIEYLTRICNEGLRKKYTNISQIHIDRLNYELEIIDKMGYVDYFLIVQDFINYAKNNDIPVGPGRGSAAGSIVSYVLGITSIDPLKYDLLFERFLNPERVSMPDIDIDFCYQKRQQVIDYVNKKYGRDSVVQIVTFGTMAARAVIRDVGRVLDIPLNIVDKIAKMIPTDLGITIDKALNINSDLLHIYNNDPQIKYLIDMSKRLEGIPRHTSIHAAGVVICENSVDSYVPLSRGADNIITTQYTMGTLEELGLLKMDFLGLRTLTVIDKSIKMVKDIYGKDIKFDELAFSDKEVYEMISKGHTEGVFQLESSGMKVFMQELKPDCLEDIIAGVSLYRPGPMDFIPTYCRRKNGLEPISYEAEKLVPILNNTYGCIVYQEQVMQIVRNLAGYTLGQSDLLRRAMSKKKTDVMEKERHNFVWGNKDRNILGCVNNGIEESVANHIYDEMIDFAKYAFNKSHAAAYAVLAYQTAYIKHYYPDVFFASMLTSVKDRSDKVSEYIETCKNLGVEIVAPDINTGEKDFTVKDGKIIFALSAIKNLGEAVIENIVEERKSKGKYVSIRDFLTRLDSKTTNKRTTESLIKSGAFDSIKGSRKGKLEQYLTISGEISLQKKNNISGQMFFEGFFETQQSTDDERVDVEEFDKKKLLEFEKEMLGVYVTGHPLEEYQDIIKDVVTVNTSKLSSLNEDLEKLDETRQVIAGIVMSVRTLTTKNNKRMAFVQIQDQFNVAEVVVFPNIFEEVKNNLIEGEIVIVSGKISLNQRNEGSIIADNIIKIQNIIKKIWISFDEKLNYNEDSLISIFKDEGSYSLNIWIAKEKMKKTFDRTFFVDNNIINKCEEKYGKNNVKVIFELPWRGNERIKNNWSAN